MILTEQEVCDMRDFVCRLNEDDGVIVVEGKRDAAALYSIGCTGIVLEFHRFGRIAKFADAAAKYGKITVLFDSDRKGRYLTGRIIGLLERRTRIDLSYKKRLGAITRGKIRFVEQLAGYAPYM